MDWIIDSGASCHMCKDESTFKDLKELETPKEITLGDGYCVKAIAKGTIHMYTNEQRKIELKDVLLIPNLSFNLLSVAKTAKSGKDFRFSDTSCQIIGEDGDIVAVAEKMGNLYHLKCSLSKETDFNMNCSSVPDSKEKLWHRRFGHLGVDNLKKLKVDQLVDGFDYDTSEKHQFCEPCVDGKHHRLPFPKSGGEKSNELLGKIHTECPIKNCHLLLQIWI